ncbi:unnamed protein product [Heligmosomoides polygyrus]|uniref:Recep_L_domain domain-containing protein n=1 Tax=Heligmosomoides polygyrus TaxID=6339 RepID=A0A183FHV3_HELPZ|nr:unnamed protein product [Heligmosomoides polygyrus]
MLAVLLVIIIAVIKSNLGELTPEEQCSFDATVISSGTKSKFPIDGQYCWCIRGSIRLDETTDVSHQELTELLRYVAIITGTLEIVNTAFHSISFFQPLFAVSNEKFKGKIFRGTGEDTTTVKSLILKNKDERGVKFRVTLGSATCCLINENFLQHIYTTLAFKYSNSRIRKIAFFKCI